MRQGRNDLRTILLLSKTTVKKANKTTTRYWRTEEEEHGVESWAREFPLGFSAPTRDRITDPTTALRNPPRLHKHTRYKGEAKEEEYQEEGE